MQRLSGSKVPLETQDFSGWMQKAASPSVPTRVIYSERDGIVAREIARLPESAQTQHVQVDSSHLAFAINPRALGAVALALGDDSVI